MISKCSMTIESLTAECTFVWTFVGVDEVVAHEVGFLSKFRIAKHTHVSTLSFVDRTGVSIKIAFIFEGLSADQASERSLTRVCTIMDVEGRLAREGLSTVRAWVRLVRGGSFHDEGDKE